MCAAVPQQRAGVVAAVFCVPLRAAGAASGEPRSSQGAAAKWGCRRAALRRRVWGGARGHHRASPAAESRKR